jgi:hypothetical protein
MLTLKNTTIMPTLKNTVNDCYCRNHSTCFFGRVLIEGLYYSMVNELSGRLNNKLATQ